jgi:hypothetical protein
MQIFITVLMFTTFSSNADNSVPVIGFTGEFAPSTWEKETIPSGLVDSSKAPESITIANPPFFKLPITKWSEAFYSHRAPIKGTLSFSFSFSMPSPSVADRCTATFSLNGVPINLTHNSQSASPQTGKLTFELEQGDDFGFGLGNGWPSPLLAGELGCNNFAVGSTALTISGLSFTPSKQPGSAPIRGFSGDFSPKTWTKNMNGPSGYDMIDTAGAPSYVILTSYSGWRTSGVGISHMVPSAGKVTFAYNFQAVSAGSTEKCPGSYVLNETRTIFTDNNGPRVQSGKVSFEVLESDTFKIALNGNGTDKSKGCETGNLGQVHLVISDFNFEPSYIIDFKNLQRVQPGSYTENGFTFTTQGSYLEGISLRDVTYHSMSAHSSLGLDANVSFKRSDDTSFTLKSADVIVLSGSGGDTKPIMFTGELASGGTVTFNYQQPGNNRDFNLLRDYYHVNFPDNFKDLKSISFQTYYRDNSDPPYSSETFITNISVEY